MKITKNITRGNIYKNYILYATPLILSSILASLYSTVDAVIAGKFINEYALGAISATSSFDILFTSFFNGFAGGFAVFIAQLFGKEDFGAIKRHSVNMTIFVAIVSVITSIFAILFKNQVMDYLNIDPILRKDAETYFIIYTSSYIFSFVNMILLRILYALGVTSFSVLTSILSAVVNITGNLVSVLIFDLGVAGLAFSTVLSVMFVTVVYVYMVIKAFGELKSEKVSYRFSMKTVIDTLSYTIPAAIQKTAFHVTGIFIAPALNGLGAAATTGYSVMNRMYSFCIQSFLNVCSAVDCHTAQAVGEGNVPKIRRGLVAGLWTNIAMLTPFLIIFSVFARPIALVFFPAGYQGPALEYAIRFFKIYSVTIYAFMMSHLMHSYLRSIGRVATVLWITILVSASRIISTLLLVPFFKMDGIYLGQSISWIIDALVSVIVYFALYHSKEKLELIIEKTQKL